MKNITYRALYVWRRDFDVALIIWKTSLVAPLVEPLFYMITFGWGLGGFVSEIPFHGNNYSYLHFIAPGILAITILYQSFFECTYGTFVRMNFQKTFDAISYTPLTIEEIILGEILWGATKAVISALAMILIFSLFGAMNIRFFPLILILAFINGIMFSSIAVGVTSKVPNIDSISYWVFFFVVPMSFLSSTFFPLDSLPLILRIIAYFFPLIHLVDILRVITLENKISIIILFNLAYIIPIGLLCLMIAIKLMRGRLVK